MVDFHDFLEFTDVPVGQLQRICKQRTNVAPTHFSDDSFCRTDIFLFSISHKK